MKPAVSNQIINTAVDGKYGSLLGVAVATRNKEMASWLLASGADVNASCGVFRNSLGMAISMSASNSKEPIEDILGILLDRGADLSLASTDHGTALNSAAYFGDVRTVQYLLAHSSQGIINSVGGRCGTALGAALSGGHKNVVQLLLGEGAGVLRVGGGPYQTPLGRFPTALDIMASTTVMIKNSDKHALNAILTTATAQQRKEKLTDGSDGTWPPFPPPFTGRMQGGSRCDPGNAPALARAIFNAGDTLTCEQADVPCRELDEEVILGLLMTLIGMEESAQQYYLSWARNDVRYFVRNGFDFGLAYAAVRVAWKQFALDGTSDHDISVNRYIWLTEAQRLDKARGMEVTKDSTKRERIRNPYDVLPRRVWDLKSNRVVEYHMLHGALQAMHKANPNSPATVGYPAFWAISHSWTSDMKFVNTAINQYQWPVPLPKDAALEQVRAELLSKFGAEYVWLDILCLRQYSPNPSLDQLRKEEWKLDVPTIGNIYRLADRVVRYFNGLGIPFSVHGWDNDHHWLRRAWTLQEIKTENTTFNGGVSHPNVLHTQGIVGRHTITLRKAIYPVLRIAAEVGGTGCSVYELAREMAKRCASQPTDKIAGLLYLLRTTELPTYDDKAGDEAAWRNCLPFLPFERKLEILFDFPYPYPSRIKGWFPTWDQMMHWPGRDLSFEHACAGWVGSKPAQLIQVNPRREITSFLVFGVSVITNVILEGMENSPEYQAKINDKVIGFYSPYLDSDPIIIPRNQELTLATTTLGQSYNWIVCEQLGERAEQCKKTPDGEVTCIGVLVLRKLGILRTDSCSELLLGGRDHSVSQVNSLFL